MLIPTTPMDNTKVISYSANMVFLKNFGKQIKYYREKRGLTQELLAGKLGSATSTISDWENGKSFIEYPSLVKLCHALDITEEHLFSFASVSITNCDLDKIMNIIKQQSPDNQKKILETLKIFFS